ncbi:MULTISPECIES: YeaH/YhbH family protein [unclassified Roseitalea]|uniref:YeaH/YhbH family protein n=1 Tax=unclassified Roseitalea TaxID=2639107 RepID=UPI00273F957F|nr:MULTISPECIES: YeaH/YhbH family protein [unclassified Roseitalea]
MVSFVDRRLNPKNKSLGNRRRFLGKVRAHVKRAVDEAVRKRSIADVNDSGAVTVPADSILEPHFQHAAEGGRRERVLPGNRDYQAGDRIRKPRTGGAGSGNRGAPGGEGEDSFAFVLSRDEFLDIFFENLELPDLVKRTLSDQSTARPHRAGISVTGSPGNLNVERTMRNALGRHIALGRPSDKRIGELRARLFELEAVHQPTEEQHEEMHALRLELEALRRRQKRVPYLDPLDVRYSYFEPRPEPNAKAVMFCLMDVSASMGEREKDLAKRFFVLLHLFLERCYERVDLVFIRHTHQASEVDEDTFFHSRETGGTVVSSALDEMARIISERYSPAEWNIYAAQASDGDNYAGDSDTCADILDDTLMRRLQYFAYVEILQEQERSFVTSDGSGTELWRAYLTVAEDWPNFAMKRVAHPSEIYPVFRELFERAESHG